MSTPYHTHAFGASYFPGLGCILLTLISSIALAQPTTPETSTEANQATLPPGTQVVEIPRTTLSLELVPVTIRVNGTEETLLVARREISWDVYDTYLYGLDQEDPDYPDDVDIVTRPTMPYINMDRGWGHTNFAAIGMSHKAAKELCTWLSHKTGRTFRLMTQAEFQAVASQSGTNASNIDARAWHAGNADDQPHARASKEPDDLGLYDLFGNVGEWCDDAKGKPIVCGGSYYDDPELLTPDTTEKPSRDWNASDPQIPKSVWWLADCTWVGIRVVAEPEHTEPAKEADNDDTSAKHDSRK